MFIRKDLISHDSLVMIISTSTLEFYNFTSFLSFWGYRRSVCSSTLCLYFVLMWSIVVDSKYHRRSVSVTGQVKKKNASAAVWEFCSLRKLLLKILPHQTSHHLLAETVVKTPQKLSGLLFLYPFDEMSGRYESIKKQTPPKHVVKSHV